MFEKIGQFFVTLYNDYFYLILIAILALAVAVVLLILRHVRTAKEKKKLTQEDFKQKSVESLTPEEIDNISNNSADPEEVKQYLITEVDQAKKSAKKRQSAQETDKKPSLKSKKQTAKKSTAASNKQTTKEETVQKEENLELKTETPEKTEVAKKAETKQKSTTPTPKKQNAEEKPEQKKHYTGKWKIVQEEDGFYAVLTASNGGALLKTEKYKSIANVKNGIETIKKNIESGNFAISIDKYGHYRYKLFNSSNRLICVSEDYSSKAKCEHGIQSVKRFAQTASVILEDK